MSHILLYTYAASIFINSYIFYEDFPDYSSLRNLSFSTSYATINFYILFSLPRDISLEGKSLQVLFFLPHGLEVHSKFLTNFLTSPEHSLLIKPLHKQVQKRGVGGSITTQKNIFRVSGMLTC